ncbi:MAG TPA: hypothetical protein VH165_03165 [Kofleriaceae bacterium]|nr:hypothetical protein [Kofleriaceae bacterium]
MRFWWALLLVGCGFQARAVGDDKPGGAGLPDADVDAHVFNITTDCPASYTAELPGPSKYRWILTAAAAGTQIDACNNDLPGRTHLVVFDSMPELMSVSMQVDQLPDNMHQIFVGGVQQAGAVLPTDNWIGFDDQPLLPGTWAGGEPNDNNQGETDHAEQFLMMEHNKHYFSDGAKTNPSGALCECDGKVVGPLATAAINAYR